MGSDFRNAPLLDDDDPVGHTDGGESMGDQDRHFSVCELLKVTKDFVFGFRVQRSGGLV